MPNVEPIKTVPPEPGNYDTITKGCLPEDDWFRERAFFSLIALAVAIVALGTVAWLVASSNL